jgi:hypothetical protein
MTDQQHQQQQQQQERYAFGAMEVQGCECPVESVYDQYVGNEELEAGIHSTLIDVYDEYIRTETELAGGYTGTVPNETAKQAWIHVINTVSEYDDTDYRGTAIVIARENGWDIDNDEIAQP